MPAKITTVQTLTLDTSNIRHAVLFTQARPGEQPMPTGSTVMAMFANRSEAEEYKDEHCPNVGLVVDLTEMS